MSEDLFPIMSIKPEWVREAEQMGSKDKFWFRRPDAKEERDWLFKYPTPGTGQHWAERIACAVALEMGLRLTPRVEFACLGEAYGTATLSFATGGYELYHGNQILAGFDTTYDPGKQYGQRMHTLSRIFDSMRIFQSEAFAEKARRFLALYLILDAVICNVDRHHENWGILRKRRDDGKWQGRLAPTFDHASSLGHNLKDAEGKQNRKRYLEDLGVGKFVERGHGAIFVDPEQAKAPSPLELVRCGLRDEALEMLFRSSLSRVNTLTRERIEAIIRRVSAPLMSPLARKFATELILFNVQELKGMAK